MDVIKEEIITFCHKVVVLIKNTENFKRIVNICLNVLITILVHLFIKYNHIKIVENTNHVRNWY